MEINALPKYDKSYNPTNCCPRFKPEGWNEQELRFRNKLFVKANTRSIFHIPINMGSNNWDQSYIKCVTALINVTLTLVIINYRPNNYQYICCVA